MDSSMTLMSANIQFLNTHLTLVHIPLHCYRHFLQTILQLLLPNTAHNHCGLVSGAVQPPESYLHQHPFINISITPVECSIVCPRTLAHDLFVPVLNALDAPYRSQVHITSDDFVVMQVYGEGLDAGQRVLELSSPLALAGIPIFFITTYYSDYILVPSRHQKQVVQALEERGFHFEDQTASYVNSYQPGRKHSASSFEVQPPTTPLPTTLSELQARTFATLQRRSIIPTVDPTIRLVQCAGRTDIMNEMKSSDGRSSTSTVDDALYMGVVKCLVSQPHPKFLSLTWTNTESFSLLLDHSLLANFAQDTLLGLKGDHLTPITLDLRDLPVESTGIVCGVASQLVGGTAGQFEEPVEMSYLSTARTGTVMVNEEELDRALSALRGVEDYLAS